MIPQGSYEWWDARYGRITGSSQALRRMIAGPVDILPTLAKHLVHQRAVSQEARMAEYQRSVLARRPPAALAWGQDHEEQARRIYVAHTGEEIEEVGLRFIGNLVAYSADGITRGRPIEIKCPYDQSIYRQYARYGCPRKYNDQVQLAMLGEKADEGVFFPYDPRSSRDPVVHVVKADEGWRYRFLDRLSQLEGLVQEILETKNDDTDID